MRVGAWRRATDEIEDLAVLFAVLGDPIDRSGSREIDRGHAAVDLLRGAERGLAVRARDVVERISRADRGGRRRPPEGLAHPALAHPRLDLLELPVPEIGA